MTSPTIALLGARRELYAPSWRERQQVLREALEHAATLAARLDAHHPDAQLAEELARQLDAARVAALRASQTARAAQGE